MKAHYLLFAFIVWGLIPVYSQNNELDSLTKLLKTSGPDTSRLKLLEEISDIAPDGDWQDYNLKMGELATMLMKSPDSSVRHFAKSSYAAYLNNLGYDMTEKGNHILALDYFQQAIKLNQELNNQDRLANNYSSLGAINSNVGNYNEALKCYKDAISVLILLDNQYYLLPAYNNAAWAYKSIHKTDSALYYLRMALKIVELNHYQNAVAAVVLSHLGELMLLEQKIDSANYFYGRSLEMSESIGDKTGKARSLLGIATIKLLQLDRDSAYILAQQSLDCAISFEKPTEIVQAAAFLKSLFLEDGNYQKAYEMFDLEGKTRDKLVNAENQKEGMRHQFEYEYNLKEATTKAEQEKKDVVAQQQLDRQKLIRNGFIGGFGVMMIFALIFFRQRIRIAKEKKISDKERKRSDELLLNILPEEVAEELKAKGAADAQLFDDVTVLFTDFKGFTAISEKLSPRELVKDLNECFSAFDRIMEKHNMEKIKTIGDSYMAAGGLPTANKTHGLDAVKAALEIRDFVEAGKAEKISKGLPYFEVRIGIHTGPVVAGIVGVKKFAYDIWGDTVNTASRMESSGEVGQVNISETTYGLVKDKFNCVSRGKVQAKGKGEIEMYFVSNPASV